MNTEVLLLVDILLSCTKLLTLIISGLMLAFAAITYNIYELTEVMQSK